MEGNHMHHPHFPAYVLICLVAALLLALGVRFPVPDTAAALLACVVAGLIWRARR